MLQADWLMLVGMGGLFVVLGVALVVRGKSGEKGHHDLSAGMDVKDYLGQEVQPRFESLKVGGWIAIAVGLFMLAMGSAVWLWV